MSPTYKQRAQCHRKRLSYAKSGDKYMTDTEAVQEQAQEVVQENIQEMPVNETQAVETAETKEEVQQEQNVPLSALQKERRKRQDAEGELKMYREHQLKQMQTPAAQEEDDSQYEPVTKAELRQQQVQMMRDVEEKAWIRQNPEKAEAINEKLANFLKKRPNLAAAIEAAPNRYEESWELMDKLSPKQKTALSATPAPKKDTPNSPSGVPKAAAMNQAVDVMNMTDSEFVVWRNSKRSRR